MGSATSPFAQINGRAVGGAVSHVADDATAVGDRHEGLEMSITVGWPPPDPDAEQHKEWVRDAWETLHPYGQGFTPTSSPTRAAPASNTSAVTA